MGNMHCELEEVAQLAPVARGICPYPNYNPSPLFGKMMSTNSSLHLRDHYRTVQSSLTPKQLEDFTQGLKTTFGREGKVTLGGVGVVALSLAVLFDTLARQARGEWVSDSGPIPGLFVKDPLRGYYPPHVYTASEYLRLVPHIANNPTRMREETERYLKQLQVDIQSLDKLGENNHTLPMKEDTIVVNIMLGLAFAKDLMYHLSRMNSTTDVEAYESFTWIDEAFQRTAADDLIFNLNCDPEEANKDFLAEVQQSENRTQEAFKSCKSKEEGKSWLLFVAQFEWYYARFSMALAIDNISPTTMMNKREDFDLKADALGKWAE
ncbi:uncharacterized protein LOC119501083 isoform X2 [Sebastes umbrosus]|uniref:uncharacterized protein LOC119501083 isoform X2 n=1 Tax=Sebastes umbrosus TaxID=72105 RepID=UPI0018A0C463|nr:uncharacterized protein LOC119501083 isoform X2 [Sebastes umbrosus]